MLRDVRAHRRTSSGETSATDRHRRRYATEIGEVRIDRCRMRLGEYTISDTRRGPAGVAVRERAQPGGVQRAGAGAGQVAGGSGEFPRSPGLSGRDPDEYPFPGRGVAERR